jgi:hypothetical protein
MSPLKVVAPSLVSNAVDNVIHNIVQMVRNKEEFLTSPLNVEI